ncbi:MAG: glycosyltransferase, partial [Methylophilaceae bacterium]
SMSSQCPVVYVDSGSTDNSIAIAKPLVDRIVQLDTSKPFSAARARNEGFAEIKTMFPNIKFVQFVDGDCVLTEGWIEAAKQSMKEEPKRATVIGHLHELKEYKTIYNRLCALEWKSSAGDLTNFGALGGISMMRADVFNELGGFNPEVIAGEDSEFGVRLSLAGYIITKINHSMATHDANMTSFGQWWRRSVRAGHAIAQRAHLNGATQAKDCMKDRKSTWVWGIGVPLMVLLLLIPTHGGSVLLLGLYVILGWRIYRFRRNLGDNLSDAFLYTRFLILGKFANGLGLLKFYLNRLKQRYEIIEYK